MIISIIVNRYPLPPPLTFDRLPELFSPQVRKDHSLGRQNRQRRVVLSQKARKTNSSRQMWESPKKYGYSQFASYENSQSDLDPLRRKAEEVQDADTNWFAFISDNTWIMFLLLELHILLFYAFVAMEKVTSIPGQSLEIHSAPFSIISLWMIKCTIHQSELLWFKYMLNSKSNKSVYLGSSQLSIDWQVNQQPPFQFKLAAFLAEARQDIVSATWANN